MDSQRSSGTHAIDQTLVDRLLGRQLSGFEVIRPIGAGGMGAIFLARQLSVGREVALKVVPDHGHEVTRARFVREAQSIARLSHPNIVQLYEYGVEPELGLLYYAMEFVEGETLADVLRRGRLHPAVAVELAMQVCSALAQTHAHNVIHRDLKASNLILTFSADGQLILKLLDFGVAHTFEDEEHRLTKTGLICGTPAYIAPEQLDGGQLLPQADLYALGVNLHFMLSGRLPFSGRSAIEIVMRQVQGPVPSLGEFAESGLLPRQLVTLCERLLAKSPGGRPASAAAVRASLAEIRDTLEPRSLVFPASGDRLAPFLRPKIDADTGAMPREWRFADYGEAATELFQAGADPDAATEKIDQQAVVDASRADDASVGNPRGPDGGWSAFSAAPVASVPDAEAYEFEPMTGPFKLAPSEPSGTPATDEEAEPSPSPRLERPSPLEVANRPRGGRRFDSLELVSDLEKLGTPRHNAEMPRREPKYLHSRVGPFLRRLAFVVFVVAFAYVAIRFLVNNPL